MPIQQIKSQSLDFGLTGAIAFFGLNTAPVGWLKANGALVSRTTYASLFAVIGTTYGVGDGSTTFALPDLRGEFPRGWDDGRGVDSGRSFASSQGSQNMFEFNDLFVDTPHDGGGNMGTSGVDFGLGDSRVPLQLNGTGYPDDYGPFTKRIGYISPSYATDTTLGSVVSKFGKAYNRLKVPIGISGNIDNGTLTQNTEARSRNVALLACIKF